ncbi:P-loop containing nucleoside triphosphate hydrolase protein [Dioscorea alata]|uniref:P-loop containing nucleoside triphosphate hydrolase protein n=3 Tax=Dioscorea alata TaxID=55571 RepID=A0ACB7WLP3_DIOAL|nr:P-loop containing nucleoside triphosphate hydrolase protein [Dioscorea alata]KAH7688923.1 P-loop containing nucleoside triphosphate hydrolase protein [Dioscorea alata]KAH7688924.1 P-loop containing nucleoside triphosphate hydrolase protein [Dioscorea alata]
MASATLSALAGSLLSPLRDISLEKLIDYLWDYLSSTPSPSCSDEAEKQQQLEDSLEALEDAKLTVRLMQSRIMKLFQKHRQNVRVVDLHNKLKDVGYDIQDLESEMKDMELERKVQEINKAEEEEEEECDSTSSQFSGKRSFPFHIPTVFLSKKKRRLSARSQSLSQSTDEDIVRQVTSIIKQINSIESKLKDEIKLEEWFDQITFNGVYDPWEQHHFSKNKRVTTSSTNEKKIYGRDDEIQRLIEFLKGPDVDGNISVVPIIGMGGIGKTTLAQLIYNNREIENYFDKKAWIHVSHHFDKFKITKEMVDIICVQCGNTTNLDLLERELVRHLTEKKFLLVLDDVWSDEWQEILTPLQSTQAQSVKIIMTCRDPKVIRSMDEDNKIILEGLHAPEYWSFFMSCAFSGKNSDNYAQALHDIGKCIIRKLKGSPLAAKTVGKLLGQSLTVRHWKDVLESDLWKLEADALDIMPALALSYYHLPQHLQLCFAFCSVFPKNHLYYMDDLICMWIANGYINENESSSKTMNDIGEEYCHELQAMCFFDADSSTWFRMHDLMHDLAQLVSHGDICIYKGGKDKKISKNVRHLYAQGLVDLGLVCKTINLHTLVLESHYDMSAILNYEAFKKIRVLVILDANMEEFPDAICHLKLLQYLDLKKTNIKSIPESLCRLYQLRVLKLPPSHTLPRLFCNPINLGWGMSGHKLISNTEGGPVYHMKRERFYMIAQLRNMNEVREPLSIVGLENIDNMEEVMKAKLKEKHHIKNLRLYFNDTVDHCKHDVQEEVLEGLQPHPNLEKLRIYGYLGSKSPSWLMTLALQKLRKLCLIKCRNWVCLPASLGLLPSLEELCLCDLENITIEYDDSVAEMFPSLHLLEFYKAIISFKGMLTSSSSSSSSLTTPVRCKLFPHLQLLTVAECDAVNGLQWALYSALERLCIRDSLGLDNQLPGCLFGLSSLTLLKISGAKIKTFPTEVMATMHALKGLYLKDCNQLLSVEGLQAIPFLRILFISACPKFRSWCMEEMIELRELKIYACQDLKSLPVWLHRLTLLKELTIKSCPKLLPLPEGGLPSSLEKLSIIDCDPGLMQWCQQERSPE